VFVLRRGNEEKKMNSFSSKEKLYITNLIWPPYNFSPSSATGWGGEWMTQVRVVSEAVSCGGGEVLWCWVWMTLVAPVLCLVRE